MAKQKNYAVALQDGVAESLGPAFSLLLQKNGDQYYFLAHAIDPNGTYFYMLVAYDMRDMEIQIPHQYVKYVLSAADMKSLGFIQSE